MRQLTIVLSLLAGLLIGVDGSWQTAQAQPKEKGGGGGPPAGRGGGGPPAGAAKGPGPSAPKQAAPPPSASRQVAPQKSAPRQAAPSQVAPKAGRVETGAKKGGDQTRVIVRDKTGSVTRGVTKRRVDGTTVVVRPGSRAHRHTHRRWRSGMRWGWVVVPSISVGDHLGWCHYHRWSARGMVAHSRVRCHRHAVWDHRSIRYVAGYY